MHFDATAGGGKPLTDDARDFDADDAAIDLGPAVVVHRRVLAVELRFSHVRAIDVLLHLERPNTFHVLERVEARFSGFLGEPRDRVLEDPAVVLVAGDLAAGAVGRLVVLTDAARSIGVDAPGEVDPELVLFPHFTGVRLPGVGHALPHAFLVGAHDGLTIGEPHSGVGLLTLDIALLGIGLAGLGGRYFRKRIKRDNDEGITTSDSVLAKQESPTLA